LSSVAPGKVSGEHLPPSAELLLRLNHCLEVDPLNHFAYFERAKYFASVNQRAKCFDDLTDCLILAGNDPHNKMVYRHFREATNFAAMAKERMVEISLGKEKTANSYLCLGRIDHAMGKAEEAIDNYTEALRIGPGTAQLFELRGEAYGYLLEAKQAAADFAKALTLDKNFSRAYAMRSLAYLLLKQSEKALSDAQELSRLHAYSAAYRLAGMAHAQLGNDQQALLSLARAIAIDGRDRQSREARIELYIKMKNYQQAINDLSVLAGLESRNEEVFSKRAQCYVCIGEYDKALSDLNFVVVHSNYGHLERGCVYLKKRDYEAALIDLNAAIKRSPFDVQAYLWRAQCYDKVGQKSLAVKDRIRAAAIKRKLLEDSQ